jgi:HEAT repeat protein
MNRIALAAAGLLVLNGLPLGCGGGGPKHGSMGARSKASLATPGFDASDLVANSGLRERAIALIEECALSEDAQIRANAVETAGLAPKRFSAVIAAGLEDKSPAVRCVAAMTVGKSRIKALVRHVQPLLNEESAFVRSAAIFALANCDAPVDRNPLAGMLLNDASPRVRSHVAYILGELKDKSALPLLRAAARERFPGATPEQQRLFELQLAEAMIKLGDDTQRPVVRAALYPSRPEELEAAALAVQIIGEVKDREAQYQLVNLSAYRDRQGNMYPAEVRLGIAGALGLMGLKEGGFIADEFAQHAAAPIRAQAAYVYGQIGLPEHWGKLDALLGDPEGSVRVAAAAGILRAMGQPRQ